MRRPSWKGLAAVGLTAAGLAISGCSATPRFLPGSATCKVGQAERTILCTEICAEATGARSGSEREDLKQCAEEQCDRACE
jgi:hypothetical protein